MRFEPSDYIEENLLRDFIIQWLFEKGETFKPELK